MVEEGERRELEGTKLEDGIYKPQLSERKENLTGTAPGCCAC